MLERLIIAGSGGQGIVFAGRLLAGVAVRAVPHITFFPSYGAEVRGGACHCQVVLSSDEIASPVSERFDSALVMNQASCDAYLHRLEPGGLAIINTSLCRPPDLEGFVGVDASTKANQLGDVRAANLVMLGAYLARRPVAPPREVEETLARLLGEKDPALGELNVRAFRAGLKT